jgi:hypothetical protein
MWIQPGAAPSLSQNSIEATLIMGGRFLMMKFRGMMMEQPFEGLQIMGYDGLQKKYVTFWVDNSSTYFYLTTGSRDESGKVLSETGDWPDPMSGGKTKVRAATTFISADEFRSEMFMTLPDGKEFKTMENRAVRKKIR